MDAEIDMAGDQPATKRALLDAVSEFRITDAESIYQRLIDDHGLDPDSDEMLPFRVTLGLLRGRLRDTMCMLNGLGEGRAPVLRAVCLKMMGDPLWEGIASEAEQTSADPSVRESMRTLLTPVEAD